MKSHYFLDEPCPSCGGKQYTDGRNDYCACKELDKKLGLDKLIEKAKVTKDGD